VENPCGVPQLRYIPFVIPYDPVVPPKRAVLVRIRVGHWPTFFISLFSLPALGF
jgi:hypothetical protein